MKSMKRITAITCSLLLVCALAIMPTSAALAAPSSADVSTATKKLQAMQDQMAAAQSAYQASAQKLAQAQTDAANSRKELKSLDARISENRKALDAQAGYLYRMGNASFIEAILSSQNFQEFISKFSYLSLVSDSNARVITSLRRDLNRHTVVQASLDKQLKAQESETASLKSQSEQATRELASQQTYVNGLTAQQKAALDAAMQAENDRSSSSKPANDDPPQNGIGIGWTFSGEASWYGSGQHTASGERFDPNALTAAHRTLPFGTLVRVTYVKTGKWVVVRINDYGPSAKTGRVIDLSRRAAELIGMTSAGVGYVTCEVVK